MEVFLEKNYLKDDTVKESKLEKLFRSPIYSRDSKKATDKGFVNIDKGEQGGTDLTAFYVKNNKSFHFDFFGRAPDKFLLQQLPKLILHDNYKL